MKDNNWEEKLRELYETIIDVVSGGAVINKEGFYEGLKAFIRIQIQQAKKEEREKLFKELCDFKINEKEPWGTIKRLRALISKE